MLIASQQQSNESPGDVLFQFPSFLDDTAAQKCHSAIEDGANVILGKEVVGGCRCGVRGLF